MKKSKFKKFNVLNNVDLSKFRVTIDDKKDYFFKNLFRHFDYNYNVKFDKIINLISNKPTFFNKDI